MSSLTDICCSGGTTDTPTKIQNTEISAAYCDEQKRAHEWYALLCSFLLGSLLVLTFLDKVHLQIPIFVAMACSMLGTFCHVFIAQMYSKLPTAKCIKIEQPIIEEWGRGQLHSPVYEKAFIIPFVIIEYFARISPYAAVGVLGVSLCISYPAAIGVSWRRFGPVPTVVLSCWVFVFVLYLAATRWLWGDEIKIKTKTR